ncbi:aldehyde dehydrogenase family protein, partial [Bradyrhizobium oligotrophicum]|uniref:aldehyde dehydrogenase family protein n=1 Tax=Bradyrhizobium oligotrophicum TaxID=44255 RepID=UPI003EC063DE
MDMFIDGKWLPAQTGARLEIVNPATGALIDTVPDAAGVDADLAIRAAERCLPAWRTTPVATRAKHEKLAPLNPRLIYASFTGYGEKGE